MLARTHQDPSVAPPQAGRGMERPEPQADDLVCRFCRTVFAVEATVVLAWLSLLCWACLAT